MHVCFLSSEYPHPQFGKSGGIGTGIKNLASALIQNGHKVTVLGWASSEISFNDNGVKVKFLKAVNVPKLSIFFTSKKIQDELNRMVREEGLDIVESPDWCGFSAFIKPKCPVVIRCNGSDTYFCHMEGRKVKSKNKFLEKRALNRANAIISVSKFTAEKTAELFKIKREISVIPNGIDVSKFVPSKTVSPNDDFQILYLGTLIRKKGVLDIPFIFNKVFEKLPNARLVLLGKDSSDIKTGGSSTWEIMKGNFNSESIQKVNYLGFKSYVEICDEITKAKVCIFPSYAEALPLSWLEAMACGKALVTSDIGWSKEIIDDGEDGFMVSPDNHQLYAERIIEVLQNEDLRRKIGENARKKVESKFSNSLIFERNLVFFQKIINSSKH